jgi:hypothetical protein
MAGCLVTAIDTGRNSSNLDVCRGAMRQRPVEDGMEGSDLVAGDGGWVGPEEPSGKRGFCDGDLVGSHVCAGCAGVRVGGL